MTLEFRPMGAEDIAWVGEAEQSIYPFPWSPRNFTDSLSAGYSSWVMRYDGTSIGYAVLMGIVDEAHVLNISVINTMQGRGFGSQLLAHLCTVAQHFGAAKIFLEVRSSNEAGIRLYERRGFLRIGCRKGYYPAVQGREDAIVMCRELEAIGVQHG